MIHDTGKIKNVEMIRLSTKLRFEEFEEAKKHPGYSDEMVIVLDGPEMAYDIMKDYRDKWDGSGYPGGERD